MDAPRKVTPRFVLREPAERLRARFDLPFGFDETQDWEVLCANGRRAGEFLARYEQASSGLSDDDRFALMALIIASFDDWLTDGGAMEPLAGRLRQQLISDFHIHEYSVWYWSLWDWKPDQFFAVTPFMREIWQTRPE